MLRELGEATRGNGVSPWHVDPPGRPLGPLLTGVGQAPSLGQPSWLWDPASATVGGGRQGSSLGGQGPPDRSSGTLPAAGGGPQPLPLHQALLHRAIGAAVAARREWDLKPVADRAQVFLKAADLLSGPRRAEVLAKTMVGQVSARGAVGALQTSPGPTRPRREDSPV